MITTSQKKGKDAKRLGAHRSLILKMKTGMKQRKIVSDFHSLNTLDMR
jgi:hypothetical protein